MKKLVVEVECKDWDNTFDFGVGLTGRRTVPEMYLDIHSAIFEVLQKYASGTVSAKIVHIGVWFEEAKGE